MLKGFSSPFFIGWLLMHKDCVFHVKLTRTQWERTKGKEDGVTVAVYVYV